MTARCSIADCGKPAKTKRLCDMHYHRLWKWGDPNFVAKPANGTVDNFINTVVIPHTGNECLEWPFARDKAGSATRGRGSLCRDICTRRHGEPPSPSYHAAHSCGNAHLGCVNPNHLSWKTPKQNNADKTSHGTSRRGVERPNAKLNPDIVRELRRLFSSGVSTADAAAIMGVSKTSANNVRSKNTWAWVE